MFKAMPHNVDFNGLALYACSGCMHVVFKAARRWGERLTVRTTAYAAETSPAPEVLPDSRTMKGGRGGARVRTF